MSQILRSIHGRLIGLDHLSRLLLGGAERGSGDPKPVNHTVYTNTAASATITNLTAETIFDTNYTIPARSLQPGERIRIRFQGIAPSTNATDTLQIRLRIGGLTGTALLTGTATDVANNATFWGEYELIVRTVGSTGTVVGHGIHKAVPAAEATVTVVDDILASTTIDTTAAQQIVVTAQWSVANAGNQVRLDCLSVERA